MASRETAIALIIGAAAVSASIIWAGTAVRNALLETRVGSAAQTPATPATTVTAPRAAEERRQQAEGPPPTLAYDSFDQLWRGEHAERAEKECWSRAGNDMPAMLHFRLSVDGTGKPTAVEPELPDRVEAERKKLAACVAGIIRSMKFPNVTAPTQARVQANRPSK